jgi:hypothetical protein
MLDFKPETEVGLIKEFTNDYKDIPKCTLIRFQDLREDYQIALQNSDRWEKWQTAANKLAEQNRQFVEIVEDLRQKIKNIEMQEEGYIQAKDNYHALINIYEDILVDIRDNVDSISWAKREAEKALNKYSDGNEPDEDMYKNEDE